MQSRSGLAAALAIAIVACGVTVKGMHFNGLMPAYGIGIEMSDDEVAAVLTYVRSSWGNTASTVTAPDVARVRSAARARTGAVTAEELKAMQ